MIDGLDRLETKNDKEKEAIINQIRDIILDDEYEIAEEDTTRPWGAFFRINGKQAERFLEEFFPGISPQEARRGIEGTELSPKILLVSPGQRLSWQYHHYRAETWRFLTPGAFHRSLTNEQGDIVQAPADEVVQFEQGERHRLVGLSDEYTLVAEVWQHVNPDHPSDEDDIIRLQDDYNRN